MKKVFKEVGSLDKRCYEKFFLNEDILMEHAADSLGYLIKNLLEKEKKVFILCGPGNNGADGIACGRILSGEYDVSIMLPFGAKSKMAKLQLQRYEAVGGAIVEEVVEADLYVDALFGSGLRRELDEFSCGIINRLNEKNAIKISCDIPSGIGDDFISRTVFKADYTISMGAYKLPLFGDSSKDFVGEISVADLGVSKDIYEKESDIYLLEESDLSLPKRDKKNTNKGTFGHTSVIAGEKGGATELCARAAFVFGSGLVSIVSEHDMLLPPYLMKSKEIPKNTTSLAVGMGLGTRDIDKMILKFDKPMVLDADIFYKPVIKELLATKENLVLTPHPKEFSSLLKLCDISDVDVGEIQKNRFKWVELFVKKYPKTTLVLKGANTLIASEKKFYINILGNSSLSKGGSGDVLGGMIGALLSQGYSAKDSAINAVIAHSLSAKNFKGNGYSLGPLDICEGLKWL